MQTLKAKAERLVKNGVLKKVNRSEWAAPAFILGLANQARGQCNAATTLVNGCLDWTMICGCQHVSVGEGLLAWAIRVFGAVVVAVAVVVGGGVRVWGSSAGILRARSVIHPSFWAKTIEIKTRTCLEPWANHGLHLFCLPALGKGPCASWGGSRCGCVGIC